MQKKKLAFRVAALVFAIAGVASGQSDPSSYTFFEERIRPLLAEKCYACHSRSTVALSGLQLDTREGLQKGGQRGPAVVPGDASASLLLEAVSYQDEKLRMPPVGKLADAQLADLRAWIEQGAPDPRGGEAVVAPVKPRGGHWAFQPFHKHALPAVENQSWVRSPIDAFVLAKLEASGLEPAPPADKRTLLRRVTFDLTGLPPTPAELRLFLDDDSPQAFEKVVERLLAAEEYGERWGRHWLDLARYAETAGHEFDQEKPDAWRYRDYVIRAFNEDLPYDRFVREQIAGDLVDRQRLTPDGSRWDSPIGTGFWGLGEERNAADDLTEVRADKIDNMVDVAGKTFLGLTVACARCHDHKFDPITAKDYYGLAGVLDSSHIVQGDIDSPGRKREIRRIQAEAFEINREITKLIEPVVRRRAATAAEYLLAAGRRLRGEEVVGDALDPVLLGAWFDALRQASEEPDHALHAFAKLALDSPGDTFGDRLTAVREEFGEWAAKVAADSDYRRERGDVVFDDFESDGYRGWRVFGAAFGDVPSADAWPNQGRGAYSGSGLANSLAGANAFVGTLVSETFRVQRPYLHVRLAGDRDGTHGRQPGQLRLELWSDGRFAQLTGDGSGTFRWHSTRLSKQDDQLAFFQIVDRTRDGHLAIDQIVLSNSKEPPAVVRAPNGRIREMLATASLESLEDLARAYQQLFEQTLESPAATSDSRQLAATLELGHPLEAAAAEAVEKDDRERVTELQRRRQELMSRLPDSAFAMLCIEDQPHDVPVYVRGDHTNPGEMAPRRFLRILSEPDKLFVHGSGRRELAEAIASPENPLTARVMVNRIWQHHFGEGLVRTVDNFGAMGETPSHPELLDTLAAMFVESGWSVKQMHRLLVLSSAYRMASVGSEEARAKDPENRLLSHMPVRRLEAEAVRDAVLAITGTLDRTHYGPPVPPHISEYQDGRGKPRSGRLDGEGRRSVYIGVRRNFISPMLLAFDYPLSVTTIGERTTSTVPSQALTLMNNEFVLRQCEKWADRLLAETADRRERIETMFLSAFARPITEPEYEKISRFIEEQAGRYHAPAEDHRVWTDLAHVLVNSKEFVFLR